MLRCLNSLFQTMSRNLSVTFIRIKHPTKCHPEEKINFNSSIILLLYLRFIIRFPFQCDRHFYLACAVADVAGSEGAPVMVFVSRKPPCPLQQGQAKPLAYRVSVRAPWGFGLISSICFMSLISILLSSLK